MLSLDSFHDGSGMLQQQQAAGVLGNGGNGGASSATAASIYIKGMPDDADKLWLYEKFAR